MARCFAFFTLFYLSLTYLLTGLAFKGVCNPRLRPYDPYDAEPATLYLLDYVWKDPNKIVNSSLITKCFNSLVERHINFWQDRISNDESCCPNRLQSANKLRTYKLLKSD